MGVETKLKNLEELFRVHGVSLAYLFGSVAETREDEYSDIDVAVLFEEFGALRQAVDLEGVLDEHFDREVDVRHLNTDDIVFKKTVIQKGIPVFEISEEKRIEFEKSVFRRFSDMKPFIERYIDARSDRLEALES